MTLLETIGAIAVAGVIGVAVGVPLGIHHEAGKWQTAVATEHQHELDAKALAAARESDLVKVSDRLNQTSDQLEAAYEANHAHDAVPAACTDSDVDLDRLRTLIEPR
jgi:hypothetical protein